jgi:endonuclease/exonuclease/phosphatase family metal-dependent hydrolase
VALLLRCDARGHAVEALTLDKDDRWEGSSQRVVLCATLDLPEGVVDVFVTHMSLSARARKRTVLELCAFADRERRRSGSIGAVLMGDLNATPEEDCIAALETPTSEGGSWLDLWKHVHGARVRGGTWPVLVPFRRIDYLFVQPQASFSVERCERLPWAGSDHCGLVARLRLRPSAAAATVGMVVGDTIA